jgi:hypothetical protein
MLKAGKRYALFFGSKQDSSFRRPGFLPIMLLIPADNESRP